MHDFSTLNLTYEVNSYEKKKEMVPAISPFLLVTREFLENPGKT